ncbi:hypothetical protein HK096_007309, partial [Nowakowskiella sp. JEL0078]
MLISQNMIPVCQQHNMPILVDGAHVNCQVPIDLIYPGESEFYMSNLHKWILAPKSVTHMFIHNKSMRRMVKTTDISNDYSLWFDCRRRILILDVDSSPFELSSEKGGMALM